MYILHYENRVKKYIKTLPLKHKKQIAIKTLLLEKDPNPNDSLGLIGHSPYKRVDCGEYRIIYKIMEKDKTVIIEIIGKRNDGQVYKEFKRLF